MPLPYLCPPAAAESAPRSQWVFHLLSYAGNDTVQEKKKKTMHHHYTIPASLRKNARWFSPLPVWDIWPTCFDFCISSFSALRCVSLTFELERGRDSSLWHGLFCSRERSSCKNNPCWLRWLRQGNLIMGESLLNSEFLFLHLARKHMNLPSGKDVRLSGLTPGE